MVKLEKQQQWEKPPSRTFEELMVHYLKATEKDKRPWGHRRDKDAIRHLWGHFSGRELAGLTAVDVRGYVKHRRVALVCNATINRELCVLSAAINYARSEWEWEIPDPVKAQAQ